MWLFFKKSRCTIPFTKWAFLNENTCTRQMEVALPLDTPSVVSAREIEPHWTRGAPLGPSPVRGFHTWKYNQQYDCLPPIKCSCSLGFHILKGRAVSGFRRLQSPQILTHRPKWKRPESFAQHYFRDWLLWNVVWATIHRTLRGPCLLGRQSSSHTLLHGTHLSPKAEKKPKNNLDAHWSEAF